MIGGPFCATGRAMRKKFSQTRPQSIGDILAVVLKKRGMGAKLQENAVVKLWPRAVGAQIASQTKPDRLHAGTLFVRASSSVWVHELHFMKEDIRSKLNELSGKETVRDIHFTVGYQPPRERGKACGPGVGNTALKDRDRKMIQESTAGIADRELAEIIQRVMEKEISLRQGRQE